MTEKTNAMIPITIAELPAITFHNVLSFVIAVDNIPCLGSVSRSWRSSTREAVSWSDTEVNLLTVSDRHVCGFCRENSWFDIWRLTRRVVLHARSEFWAPAVRTCLLQIGNTWRASQGFAERFVDVYRETTHALISEYTVGIGLCCNVDGRGNPVNNIELGFTNIYPSNVRGPGQYAKIGVHFDELDATEGCFQLRISYDSATCYIESLHSTLNIDQFAPFRLDVFFEPKFFWMDIFLLQSGKIIQMNLKVPAPFIEERFLSRRGCFHSHLLVRDVQQPLPCVTIEPIDYEDYVTLEETWSSSETSDTESSSSTSNEAIG